jgi:hypothetical protein
MRRTITLNRKVISKAIVAVVVVAGFFSYVAYEIGYHQATNGGKIKLLTQADIQSKQWSKDRLALDRMASDYNTACYNYQVLYDAYDQMYKKVGVSAGVTHISRPDGAKGNEDSCYR